MVNNFVHTSYASRVVFGSLDQVADEVELLGVRRVVVIATGSAQQAADVVEAAVAPSDGGIGTMWIVLMSVSGALVLAGVAYCATRLVRRRSHALT